MTFIYYVLFFLTGFTVEVSSLGNSGNLLELKKRMKAWVKSTNAGVKSEMPKGFELQFFYSFLGFLGLFTSQWPLFLLLMIIGFVPKNFKFVIIIDAILSILIILAIVINKFHIHYDLTAFVLSYFK